MFNLDLFSDKASDPTANAQRNLMGRTHFVDPDTLRFHKSRVLRARHHDDGLLFSIVTSDSLDWNNTKRGFRYAIFDIFGTCLDRPDLEQSFKTSEQANKARYAALDAIDAKTHTLLAIERMRALATRELDDMEGKVRSMTKAEA